MIKAEKLSFSFPQKDLYHKISFTLEDNQHCAFIGTNGTGKSTLIEMIRDPEKYIFEGKLLVKPDSRIGYVSQLPPADKSKEQTVFDYLAEEFVALQDKINQICEEMGTTEDLDSVMEEYQRLLDLSDAMDADNYESNIRKQLKNANLAKQENLPMGKLSGGEYKLVCIMKEMLVAPDLLIMDEPDGFLDFDNLNALMELINSHKGTLLVVTHNRYLLNHCFDKILHLENTEIQEFDGNYIDYNFTLLQTKIELQEQSAKEEEEIARNRAVVEKLRAKATKIDSATTGRQLHARVSHLALLEARKIKAPFIQIRQPEIVLHTAHPLGEDVGQQDSPQQDSQQKSILCLSDYSARFDELLLEHVNFEIAPMEKVAIVGPNGTGKTTMLRDIYKGENDAIMLADGIEMAFLSQMQGEMLNEEHTVLQEFEALGLEREQDIKDYICKYCFEEEVLYSKIGVLSGGEKNLLQLAKIALGNANLLLLDEPTSHLDTYAQNALEQAIQTYNGAVLMVSHDFYTIANCMDYVLLIEEGTIRRMSIRAFRRMIYSNHFSKDYLELEQKKKELETRIGVALRANDIERAKKLSEELETVIQKL